VHVSHVQPEGLHAWNVRRDGVGQVRDQPIERRHDRPPAAGGGAGEAGRGGSAGGAAPSPVIREWRVSSWIACVSAKRLMSNVSVRNLIATSPTRFARTATSACAL